MNQQTERSAIKSFGQRMSRIGTRLGFAVFFGVLVLSYQNCSKVGFTSMSSLTCAEGQTCGSDLTGESPLGETPEPLPEEETLPEEEVVKKTLALGILTKNMACVMCHTTVNGDISGFGTMTFRADSSGHINGHIFAADQKLQRWNSAGTALDPSFIDTHSDPDLIAHVLPSLISSNLILDQGAYRVRPGEKHNIFNAITFGNGGGLHTMTMADPAERAKAQANLIQNPFLGRAIIEESDFPALNVAQCKSQATGYIRTADGQTYASPIAGNAVFVNGARLTAVDPNAAADSHNAYDVACPKAKTLEIRGEVVVSGDLVLAGCVKGNGSIYAEGNIYIPDDIKNVRSAFPFPTNADENTLKADVLNKADRDMLSLGSAGFIMLGSISDIGILTHEEQDPIFRNNLGMIHNLHAWLTTGSPAASKDVYNRAFLKRPIWQEGGRGAIALIEANLYANMGIALALTSTGKRRSNFVLNGSVITPNLQMLVPGNATVRTAPGGGELTTNPFNGKAFRTNESAFLNQDYRLKFAETGFECHRIRTQ